MGADHAAAPYLGIELKLNMAVISDLLYNLPEDVEPPPGAISFVKADDSIIEPLLRLMRLLDKPAEIPVLAQPYQRELCYRLLQSSLAPRLRQFGSRMTRLDQVRAAANWIIRNAEHPLSVQWLANHVGMSVTSFHRHFRAITSHTPLGYRQQIRLVEARRRLADGHGVTETAFVIGYTSASQFSREYKRAFGRAPVRDLFIPNR